MVFRAWNEHEEINDTSLSFESARLVAQDLWSLLGSDEKIGSLMGSLRMILIKFMAY